VLYDLGGRHGSCYLERLVRFEHIYISMIITSFQSIPLYLDMGDLDNKIELGRVVEYQIFGQHRIMPT